MIAALLSWRLMRFGLWFAGVAGALTVVRMAVNAVLNSIAVPFVFLQIWNYFGMTSNVTMVLGAWVVSLSQRAISRALTVMYG